MGYSQLGCATEGRSAIAVVEMKLLIKTGVLISRILIDQQLRSQRENRRHRRLAIWH